MYDPVTMKAELLMAWRFMYVIWENIIFSINLDCSSSILMELDQKRKEDKIPLLIECIPKEFPW